MRKSIIEGEGLKQMSKLKKQNKGDDTNNYTADLLEERIHRYVEENKRDDQKNNEWNQWC
jgi:hypothetical protein